MKQFLVIILLLVFVSPAFADMTSDQGEEKVINYLKQIYRQCESAKSQLDSVYLKAKNYVQNHSSQFDEGDRTKLNDLQALKTTVTNALLALNDQIKTDFPGIDEN